MVRRYEEKQVDSMSMADVTDKDWSKTGVKLRIITPSAEITDIVRWASL